MEYLKKKILCTEIFFLHSEFVCPKNNIFSCSKNFINIKRMDGESFDIPTHDYALHKYAEYLYSNLAHCLRVLHSSIH